MQLSNEYGTERYMNNTILLTNSWAKVQALPNNIHYIKLAFT